MMTSLLLLNAFCTWFMTGLIWFVQVVHYPLFGSVGIGRFQDYVNLHRELTTAVVAAPMVIEAISSLLLALQWKRADATLLWINLGIVMIIWISTACCSIPCHEKLCSGGYCESTHHWLVLSNWVRTIGWTLRSAILFVVMWHALEGQQVLPALNAKS